MLVFMLVDMAGASNGEWKYSFGAALLTGAEAGAGSTAAGAGGWL